MTAARPHVPGYFLGECSMKNFDLFNWIGGAITSAFLLWGLASILDISSPAFALSLNLLDLIFTR
jgi:hypothetical protein